MVETSDAAFKALSRASDLPVRLCHVSDRWLSKGFVCFVFFLRFLADRYALWRRFSVSLVRSDFCIVY